MSTEPPDISDMLRQSIIQELRRIRPNATEQDIAWSMAEHDKIVASFKPPIQQESQEAP